MFSSVKHVRVIMWNYALSVASSLSDRMIVGFPQFYIYNGNFRLLTSIKRTQGFKAEVTTH